MNIDEGNIKIHKNMVEVKKKSIQANSDKIELLRDLATYEVNFTYMVDVKNRLATALQGVQHTQAELKRRIKFKEDDS